MNRRFRIALFFTLLAFKAQSNITLDRGVFVSDQQINQIRNSFPKLDNDKIFFHWTRPETGIRWILKRHIDSGEVNFLNQPSGQAQAYGPGVYMAAGNTSSNGFGSFCVGFRIKKGTPIYDHGAVRRILGVNLSHLQISQLGTRINYIRHLNGPSGDWWSTHSAENLNDVIYAPVAGPGGNPKWGNFRSTQQLVYFLAQGHQKNNPAGEWLESFINLGFYLDGVAYYRAAKRLQNHPWGAFDESNFEKYRNATNKYRFISFTNDRNQKKNIGINSGSRYGNRNNNRDQWVNDMVGLVVPSLYEDVSGNSQSNKFRYYRRDEIRAGGSFTVRNINNPSKFVSAFQVTAKELLEYQNNKYLTVIEHEKRNDGTSLISYFYPDVWRYQKLKGLIPDNLWNAIDRDMKAGHFTNDKNKVLDGNESIITHLLRDMFAKYFQKNIDFRSRQKENSVQLLKDFISIHPFSDFNGRVTRLFVDVAHMQANLAGPYTFLADLDLSVPVNEYQQFLQKGSEGHRKLVESMLVELLTKVSHGQVPQHYQRPEWEELWLAVQPFGAPSPLQLRNRSFSDHEFNLIGSRKFTELFSLLGFRID